MPHESTLKQLSESRPVRVLILLATVADDMPLLQSILQFLLAHATRMRVVTH